LGELLIDFVSMHHGSRLADATSFVRAAGNENPKPFVWTATVESIQEELSHCRQTLEQIQPGCTQPRSRKAKKKLSS
jgi:hypothetical protein